jgi:hypothetical protein
MVCPVCGILSVSKNVEVNAPLEGFQKWIIRADYLPDNPMDTPRIKFAETIKRSR